MPCRLDADLVANALRQANGGYLAELEIIINSSTLCQIDIGIALRPRLDNAASLYWAKSPNSSFTTEHFLESQDQMD